MLDAGAGDGLESWVFWVARMQKAENVWIVWCDEMTRTPSDSPAVQSLRSCGRRLLVQEGVEMWCVRPSPLKARMLVASEVVDDEHQAACEHLYTSSEQVDGRMWFLEQRKGRTLGGGQGGHVQLQ